MSLGSWGKWAVSLAETAAAQVAQTAKAASDKLAEASKVFDEGKEGGNDGVTPEQEAVLPWEPREGSHDAVWVQRYTDDIHVAVLQLSQQGGRFIDNPPPEQVGFEHTFNPALAAKLLEADPNLETLRFKVVPARVKEDEFWRNYFYAVSVILDSFRMRAEADGNLATGGTGDDVGAGAGAGGAGAGAGDSDGGAAGQGGGSDVGDGGGAVQGGGDVKSGANGAGGDATQDASGAIDEVGGSALPVPTDPDDAEFENALNEALGMELDDDDGFNDTPGDAGGLDGDLNDDLDEDALLAGLDEFTGDDDGADVDPDWEAAIRAELGLNTATNASNGGGSDEPGVPATAGQQDDVQEGDGGSGGAGSQARSGAEQDSRGSWELVR